MAGAESPAVGSRRRRFLLVVGVAVAVVAAAIWSALPWEWSWIDDPKAVLTSQRLMSEHGPLPGILAYIAENVRVDVGWGLFRPSYWLYTPLVYWAPIGPVHVLRLAMLVVALAGPLVAFRRQGRSTVALVAAGLVILSGSFALIQGLFFVSLQELSGAAFVGVGLMVRGRWARVVPWLVAAWFKSPFAWLLVGDAVVLWRRGRRADGILVGLLAAGTLVAAWWMAKGGSYTAQYGLSGPMLTQGLAHLPDLVSAGILLPIAGLLWWLVWTRTRPAWTDLSLVLLIGAIGYTVQMLPWSVVGHYQGGVGYTLAVFLASLVSTGPRDAGSRALVALVVPLMAGTLALSAALSTGFERNATWRELTDCLHRLGPVRLAVGYDFGPEAAVRIPQNVDLRYGSWGGSAVFVEDPSRIPAADVLLLPAGAAAPAGSSLACTAGPAAVYGLPGPS